tara:strand:- start:43002 stop:43550 length:549 start_codon:yes stop_codon:yes gene_type:complete
MQKVLLTALLFISMLVHADEKIIQNMLDGIAEVESLSGLLTNGDGGKAVGHLQIWKITVDDVNRIYKTSYTYQDRNSVQKSEDMFIKYLSFWGKQYQKNTGQYPTEEIYARIWNGGPIGYKKRSTVAYWNKYLKTKRERYHEKIIKKPKSKYCQESVQLECEDPRSGSGYNNFRKEWKIYRI